MANCPNCGSDRILLKKDTNTCLDCGTTWEANALNNSLQIVKEFTGKQLDLSQERDREFLNAFLAELTPDIDRYHEAVKRSQIASEHPDRKLISNKLRPAGGMVIGIIAGILAGFFFRHFLVLVLIFGFLGWIIGVVLDTLVVLDTMIDDDKPIVAEKFPGLAKKIEESAKKDLEHKARNFLARHPYTDGNDNLASKKDVSH